jgi:hypothetical protein
MENANIFQEGGAENSKPIVGGPAFFEAAITH